MPRNFNVVIERDAEGLYVASVPSLPGCHTQGATIEQALIRIREAIALQIEDGDDNLPELEFVAVERITVAA